MNIQQKTAFILANLKNFGVTDVVVTGKVDVRSARGDTVRAVALGSISLALLCATSSDVLSDICKAAEKGESVGCNIDVLKDGEPIGYIDSNGRFKYTAAPDLRTCLAWAVATDRGQHESVTDYDLDSEAKNVADTFSLAPPLVGYDEYLKPHFFGEFWATVACAIGNNKGSRFSDGYCGVMCLLWQVGTRTIRGLEHKGFSFSY